MTSSEPGNLYRSLFSTMPKCHCSLNVLHRRSKNLIALDLVSHSLDH